MRAEEDAQELVSSAQSRMDWCLRFTSRSVLVSWSWRCWAREKRWRLDELSPQFVTLQPAQEIMAFVLGGFSGFFAWLALQNPGENAKGLWVLASVCLAGLILKLTLRRGARTLVKCRDGSYAFILDHCDFDPEELQAFLHTLKQRIEDSMADPESGETQPSSESPWPTPF
jgi:hypothetical protein